MKLITLTVAFIFWVLLAILYTLAPIILAIVTSELLWLLLYIGYIFLSWIVIPLWFGGLAIIFFIIGIED